VAAKQRETREWWLFDPRWRTLGPDVPLVRHVTAERIHVNVVDRPPGDTTKYVFWMVKAEPADRRHGQQAPVAVSTVARAEGGGATTPLIAQKLAKALGVSVDDLRQQQRDARATV
jgi:hypothetical protein